MKILAVDIGTGTQDILLFDSRLDAENSFKLVVPSPTMIFRRRIQAATAAGRPLLMSGVTMGGGPCAWAVEDHLKAGLPVFATPDAARTLNDDLDAVQAMGVRIFAEGDRPALPEDALALQLKDFDFAALRAAFAEFGIRLDDLDAVAVAVFDHGAAPPEISDRQFRFDYLDERIRAENRLAAFAYPADQIPAIMTRLQAVADSARDVSAPLIVMDTAPAAVLGALHDQNLNDAEPERVIANVGNFHTLAFRIGENGIGGVFEHHTGFLDRAKLEGLLLSLAEGSLTHADVFGDMGHGALVYAPHPLNLQAGRHRLVVTGPRRSMLAGSRLNPYFAAPFGDMMISGCFGLLAAVADRFPRWSDEIQAALAGRTGRGTAPWDAG